MTGRHIALIALLFFSTQCIAAQGYTPWAVVTKIERVGDGIIVYGDFGDVGACGQSNLVYYPSVFKDYDVVVSMALTALTAEREMRFYVDSCVAVSFHWGASPVVNQARNGQAIFIR